MYLFLFLLAIFLALAFVSMLWATAVMLVIYGFILFNIYVLITTIGVIAKAAWKEFVKGEPCR